MLKHTEIANLGSKHTLEIDFGSKLTLITGDADLHQRVLLEGTWRCMTSWWIEREGARSQPIPADPAGTGSARALFVDGRGKTQALKSVWNAKNQDWSPYRQYADQTAVYAAADDSFHVWIGWNREHITSYHHVTADEVWRGQASGPSPRRWPGADELTEHGGDGATTLASPLLRTLIPQRYLDRYVNPEDSAEAIARKRPAGGVGRMAALAFLTAWAYERTIDESLGAGILLIVEEPELHIHPSWQRESVTRLAKIQENLDNTPVQLVTATNSPLVTASAEPLFDPETTLHWNVSIDRETGSPVAEALPVYRRGTADDWLMSNAFGLHTARNDVAEAAIQHAKRLQIEDGPDVAEALEVDRSLRECLGDTDPFWPRWTYWIETLRKTRAKNR